MHVEHDYEVFVIHLQQPDPQQRPFGQVKRGLRFLCGQPAHRGLTIHFGAAAQIGPVAL